VIELGLPINFNVPRLTNGTNRFKLELPMRILW
jgi:hypothetical protein